MPKSPNLESAINGLKSICTAVRTGLQLRSTLEVYLPKCWAQLTSEEQAHILEKKEHYLKKIDSTSIPEEEKKYNKIRHLLQTAFYAAKRSRKKENTKEIDDLELFKEVLEIYTPRNKPDPVLFERAKQACLAKYTTQLEKNNRQSKAKDKQTQSHDDSDLPANTKPATKERTRTAAAAPRPQEESEYKVPSEPIGSYDSVLSMQEQNSSSFSSSFSNLDLDDLISSSFPDSEQFTSTYDLNSELAISDDADFFMPEQKSSSSSSSVSNLDSDDLTSSSLPDSEQFISTYDLNLDSSSSLDLESSDALANKAQYHRFIMLIKHLPAVLFGITDAAQEHPLSSDLWPKIFSGLRMLQKKIYLFGEKQEGFFRSQRYSSSSLVLQKSSINCAADLCNILILHATMDADFLKKNGAHYIPGVEIPKISATKLQELFDAVIQLMKELGYSVDVLNGNTCRVSKNDADQILKQSVSPAAGSRKRPRHTRNNFDI